MDIAVLSLLILSTISCALIGVYIVSFKASMIVEGLSHAVLLGVVLIYLIFNKVNATAILVASLLSGVFVIALVEILSRTKYGSKDVAIGIVMPLLFSVAIAVMSGPLRNSRLTKEMILTGNIILATYSELIGGVFPVSILINIIVLIINIVTLTIFSKELKVSAFDNAFAKSINAHPRTLYYLFIINVTLTIGGTVDSFGIVLIIGMFVFPASIAMLISKNQKEFVSISVIIAIAVSIVGYAISSLLDLSHSGTITSLGLFALILTVLFRKGDGAIYAFIHRISLKKELEFVIFLNTIGKNNVKNISEVREILGWKEIKLKNILDKAIKKQYLIKGQKIQLTQGGNTVLAKYYKTSFKK